MDWQTKEHIDEKFQNLEDDIQLIKSKLGIKDQYDFTDSEEDKSGEEEKEEFSLV